MIADPAPMAPVRKSERTREALRRAALRHFVEHGFEASSVPAIAAEVGVTERTFYRHFATKDEVLFIDVTSGLAWFRTTVSERLDAGDDAIAAVLAAITSPASDPRLMLEISRLRNELLSPARIERSFRDAHSVMARHMREVLVERGMAALEAAVRAEIVTGAVFAALTVWTEAPGDHGLAGLVRMTSAALEQVRPALG
ncbi:MAG: helix-turn-helix domain-containing protein [Nocardioides sp.]